MSEHCCPRRCRRLPFALLSLFVVVIAAGLGMVAATVGDHGRSIRSIGRKIDWQIDGITAADAALSGRIDSADRHVAELAKMTHERRAILADELRKETAGAVAAIESRLEQEKVTRGSQVNAERAERRNAIAALEDAAGANAAMILREMQVREEAVRSIAKRLDAIEGRLKALETPKPAPAAVKTPRYRLYTDGCRTFWLPVPE